MSGALALLAACSGTLVMLGFAGSCLAPPRTRAREFSSAAIVIGFGSGWVWLLALGWWLALRAAGVIGG